MSLWSLDEGPRSSEAKKIPSSLFVLRSSYAKYVSPSLESLQYDSVLRGSTMVVPKLLDHP